MGRVPRNRKNSDSLVLLRRPLQLLGDLTVLTIAFIASYLPMVNVRLDEFYLDLALLQAPLVVLIQFSMLYLFGVYGIIWRYISLGDLKPFLKAATASALILLFLRFFAYEVLTPVWKVPVSSILIDTALGFGGLLVLRVLRRAVYETGIGSHDADVRTGRASVSTLVIGAGRLGAIAVKEILAEKDSGIDIKGFIDDDVAKVGGRVGGVKVLGTTDDLPRLVSDMEIAQVVIAIGQVNATDIRRILDSCRKLDLRARILPSIGEIAGGTVEVNRVRDVAGALLVSLGHEVAFAGGGTEALQKIPTEQFDLVLMDLQMPQMDGFDTARAIRAMPAPLGEVPIFALTASVMPEQIAAAHDAGMNGHIGKPLSRNALATALADLHKMAAGTGHRLERANEASPLPDISVVDHRVLNLLKSELNGAAAGVVREFLVEMQTIRDQFAAELAQAVPRADVITQNAHRLLGAARTLGAMQLAQHVTEFQKLQPRESGVFQVQSAEALRRVIAETNIALEALEAFFHSALIGETA